MSERFYSFFMYLDILSFSDTLRLVCCIVDGLLYPCNPSISRLPLSPPLISSLNCLLSLSISSFSPNPKLWYLCFSYCRFMFFRHLLYSSVVVSFFPSLFMCFLFIHFFLWFSLSTVHFLSWFLSFLRNLNFDFCVFPVLSNFRF